MTSPHDRQLRYDDIPDHPDDLTNNHVTTKNGDISPMALAQTNHDSAVLEGVFPATPARVDNTSHRLCLKDEAAVDETVPSRIPCLSDGISDEDEARLKELFSKLDRNEDGQICIEDLAKAFRELR